MNKMPLSNHSLLIVLFGLALFGCKEVKEDNSKNQSFEWNVSSLSSKNIDSIKIDSIHQDILAGDYGLVDHLLILRNGDLVFDQQYHHNYDSIAQLHDSLNFQYNYDHTDWHPFYRDSKLHSLQSCSKSITSLLVGIAIDEGLIPNVDINAMELFDYKDELLEGDLKDSITLQDLLTMRGGFKWDEWSTTYTDPQNNCYILESSDNWLEYVLQIPMDTVPGTKFVYNGGITVLLGEIVRIKTGSRIDKWAEEKLFKPLDIEDYYWKTSPNGEVDTEGGLYLSIHDFAKIGQLVMNKGMWQGTRVVSEEWLKESTSQLVDLSEHVGYGYQWWLWNPPNDNVQRIMANGFGGQYLIIDHENDLLIAMNGWQIHDAPEKDPMYITISVTEAINK